MKNTARWSGAGVRKRVLATGFAALLGALSGGASHAADDAIAEALAATHSTARGAEASGAGADWIVGLVLRDVAAPQVPLVDFRADVTFPNILGGTLGGNACDATSWSIDGGRIGNVLALRATYAGTDTSCPANLLVYAIRQPSGFWTGIYLWNFDQPGAPIRNALVRVTSFEPSPCSVDTDGDRLSDCVETGTGIFNGPADTGTDPDDPDTDGDALDDGDEVLGTLGGLDLPALGTNPLRKNILIEYDWFDDSISCGAHSHRPNDAVLAKVEAAFASAPVANPDGSTGITILQDRGQGGAFGGGNLIADADGVLTGGVNSAEFQNHKAANFDPAREDYFHYTILPHYYNTNSTSSGQAELPGDDLIVSLYCSNSDQNVANTILHEAGHNLLLRHGGDENCNYKPNYNSVMNYAYQFPGVDDDCTPPGDGVLDYSWGDRITLVETNLDENEGTCGPGNPWDWNGNTILEVGIAYDVNPQDTTCGALTVLQDFDDWSNLLYSGVDDFDLQRRGLQEMIECQSPPAP